MKRGMWIRLAVWAALSGGLGLLAMQSVAEAQFNPRARPRFGGVNLNRGFMPDPQIVSGSTGGPVAASQVMQGCRGYITSEPSHVVSTRSGFGLVRFVVNADRDATLTVMLPNGQILCDDDGGEGVNPLIQTASPPGNIAVWVGSYSSSSAGAGYRLGITELSHITASTLNGGGQVAPPPPPRGGGLNTNAAPMFGTVNLRSGFMPDPQIVSGTSGGPMAASQAQSGCRGYISPQPSHVVNSGTGFRQIRFVVNSGTDTTLVVMLPNGQILCNDDGGSGLNPLISTQSPPGPIRVWVGVYSSSAQPGPYNMGITELSHITTANIPSPGGGAVVARPPNVPPPTPGELVQMVADIPVTLMGPGLGGNTVAVWNPSGGPPTQITLSGRTLSAGGVVLESVPPSMRDPVITVTQRRNGTVVVRAEQPPTGRRDRGQQMLLLVRWQGRPAVAERWSGTAVQRGPRWSR